MPTTAPPLLPSRTTWQQYHHATRTASYGFLMALPLLVFYEALILLVNRGQVMQVRVGADVWMKTLLHSLGGAGVHVLAVVVLLIGIGVFIYDRRRSVPIRPRYFGWMVLESAAYAVVVALLVSTVVGLIFFRVLAGPQGAVDGLWMQLALSIGAGLYEELFFRVLLVGGLFWVLRQTRMDRTGAYLAAALVGALLFSAVHYIGALGDAFTLSSFTFRFLFGLALNALFLWRGFGVAAWTHALYDVLVVTHLLG